jgi:hypothetical protein
MLGGITGGVKMTARDLAQIHVEQDKAWRAVELRVKAGKLSAPDKCQACGKTGRLVSHHENYDRPLAVQWLCRSCHSRLHANLENEIAKSQRRKAPK